MPDPLTSEERARLLDELNWLAQEQVSFGAARIIQEARAELARTADDARDARRYRYVREHGHKLNDRDPWTGDRHFPSGEELDREVDAALASSKSEAAEGGEDGICHCTCHNDPLYCKSCTECGCHNG